MILKGYFMDKNNKPTDSDLIMALEKNKQLWEDLLISIKDKYDNISEEWKFPEKKLIK